MKQAIVRSTLFDSMASILKLSLFVFFRSGYRFINNAMLGIAIAQNIRNIIFPRSGAKAKLCTEFKTPDLTKNIPKIDSMNVRIFAATNVV